MRILKINEEGEARVISLNNKTWERDLDIAICTALDSVPAEPIMQNGVWPECEYTSNILLYMYTKEDTEGEKENEYCKKILASEHLKESLRGPVIIVKYVRTSNQWGFHPASMGRDELKYLFEKMDIYKIENLYPYQDRREGLWWKKEQKEG